VKHAYIYRGLTYDQIKNHEKAIEDYTEAIKEDPNNGLTYYNRGVVYNYLEQYDEAINDYS
jgi:tetratricopeptide (TPR) repeat protein